MTRGRRVMEGGRDWDDSERKREEGKNERVKS